MSKFIQSKEAIKNIFSKYKKSNKKIALTHGVFDVIHLGHLDYFKEAKQLADILVVSVTADKFVDKGLNKPFFNEKDRAYFLTSLEMIDYVIINNHSDSCDLINLIKPNFYVKGPDYKKKSGDVAGNLSKEKKAVIKNKGKIHITSGRQHSSSKIINEKLDFLSELQKKHINKLKKNNTKTSLKQKFEESLKKIKKEKILIIGEIIIDTYRYVEPLGQPSKENILSSNTVNSESFLGGTVPVVNNISQMNNNVTFVSVYKEKRIVNQLKSKINKSVRLKVFKNSNFIDIEKTRYVNNKSFSKMFEVYNFRNKTFNDQKLNNYLKKTINNYDHVIICDFGHGLINSEIVKILNKSKYLSANIQTNSGNRGYNLFTKYKKLDFLSVDEPELRLGLVDKESDHEILIKKIEKKYKNIMLTRGIDGLLFKKYKKKIIYFPALATNPRDTIGAGDTTYSFASCFVKNSKDSNLISFVSAIAGALKVNIIGHRTHVNLNEIYKTLINLTK